MKGFPDIAGLWHGEAFFIEVKAPKGKLSKEQKAWMTNLTANDAWYCLATSLEGVIQFLGDIECVVNFKLNGGYS